jgi:hypothetical protein
MVGVDSLGLLLERPELMIWGCSAPTINPAPRKKNASIHSRFDRSEKLRQYGR